MTQRWVALKTSPVFKKRRPCSIVTAGSLRGMSFFLGNPAIRLRRTSGFASSDYSEFAFFMENSFLSKSKLALSLNSVRRAHKKFQTQNRTFRIMENFGTFAWQRFFK